MAKPNARRAGLPFKSIQSALEFNSGIIIIHAGNLVIINRSCWLFGRLLILALNLPGCKPKREKNDVDSIGIVQRRNFGRNDIVKWI
jgi:hypothetical protein